MPPPLPADGFQRPNPRSGFPVGQKMPRRGADGSDDDDNDDEEVDPQVAAALSAALFSDLTTQKQVVAATAAAEDDDDVADASPDDIARSGAEALEALSKPPAARRKECIFCDDKPAKYTCPRCNARTCSLVCVKRHKAEAECSGIVEAAAPVPLNEFSDKHLTRDYHFMQDMDRVVSNVQRGLDRHWRYDIRALPPPLYALREAAKKRGVLCQITSEGMSKRDRNTSRFDRRRDAIIWHIDFDVRGTVRSKNFRVESHWGNERFRLGDVFATAWQTNPALLCFHIRRGYNRASAWVEKGIERKQPQPQPQPAGRAPSPSDEAVESAADAARENAEEEQAPSPHTAASQPQAPSLNGIPSALVETGEKDEFRTAEDDSANKGVTVSDSDDDDDGTGRTASSKQRLPGGRVPEPTTPRSMTAKANVTRYLDESPDMARDLLFLVRAERLGTTEAYFRLNPDATIHDNLRHVFFVNEYPTVVVAKMQDAANYPIVSEDQRIAIRETFRPKNHRNDGAGFRGGGAAGGAPAPPPFHRPQGADPSPSSPGADGAPEGQPQPPRVDFDNLSEEQRERLARVPCRQFRRNERCDRGDACPFWHCPIAELPACRNMVQMGQCPLGPRCSFSHDEAVVRRTREDPEFRRVRRGGDDEAGDHDRRTSTRGGRGGGRGAGRGGGGAYLRGFTGPAGGRGGGGGAADGHGMQRPPPMENVGPSQPHHYHHHQHDGASSAPPPSPVYHHGAPASQQQQQQQAAFPPGYARYLPAEVQHHHHHQPAPPAASREPSAASHYGGGSGGGWEPPQ